MRRLALVVAAACGAPSRAVPYRFASPMLGAVDVPAETLPAAVAEAPLPTPIAHVATIGEPARVDPTAHAWAQLADPRHAAAEPALHRPADLRALVGRRESRDPFATTMAWARALGATVDADSIDALASRGTHDAPAPGDLLVFARTDSADAVDLVAIAVATDARGVTDFVYLAGGIVRRGFVDPARPAMRRDADGAVVNTYLRAGKRWPPKGTHYLAGELLVAVRRAR